jgi:hypothetical protein
MIGVGVETNSKLPPVMKSQMRENQDGVWAQKRQWACRSELLVRRMVPWGEDGERVTLVGSHGLP